MQQTESTSTTLTTTTSTQYVILGLYGELAPTTVSELVALSSGNFLSPCTPATTKNTARETLEGKRVYSACVSDIDEGASYEGSSVWRVVKGERVDFGALRGKWLGRQEPSFPDDGMGVGVGVGQRGAVSVSKGGGGGYGFTITPNNGPARSLSTHVVVGRVMEGFGALDSWNGVGVVKSGIGGGGLGGLRDKPSRECRYGSAASGCSEYKPLKKMEIVDVAVRQA